MAKVMNAKSDTQAGCSYGRVPDLASDLGDHLVSAFADLALLAWREVELLYQVVPVVCAAVALPAQGTKQKCGQIDMPAGRVRSRVPERIAAPEHRPRARRCAMGDA